jgi:hypothetical protein
MQDNTKRAKRVLFWIKAVLILFVLLWLQFIFVFLFGLYAERNILNPYVSAFLAMFHVVFSLCVGAAMFLSAVFFFIRFLSWLYRAVSNLRILTTTHFSPMSSVLLTCIPFVGYFLHYLIFNDMVKSQEKYMQQRGILKERFPQKFLNAWIILSILCFTVIFCRAGNVELLTVVLTAIGFDGSYGVGLFEKSLLVLIFILYVKSFSSYIKQEQEIFRIHTEELFRRHVDEVIREREIERVANMLRESENAGKAQTQLGPRP